MSHVLGRLLAADLLPPALDPAQQAPGPMARTTLGDAALVILAALVIGLAAVLAAVFLRPAKRKERRSKTVTESTSRENLVVREVVSKDGGRRKIRYRRRRRDHRPRNPTLAETGGLPPIRPDGE